MMLLTKELREKLPPLYSQENEPDPIVHVKFFHPVGRSTWYITEFDGADIMFGLCCLHEAEIGYVSLAELQSVKVMGLGIERDRSWKPKPLSEAKKEAQQMGFDV